MPVAVGPKRTVWRGKCKMLDKLNAKKAALVAQRDQAVANLNALVGAIAFCDEMIADAVTEQIAAKAAAAEQERINETQQSLEVPTCERCGAKVHQPCRNNAVRFAL